MPIQQINWSSVTTPSEFFGIANTNTSGYFWTGIIWMFFLVVLITLSSFMIAEGALLASAFITFLVAILLLYNGLISFGTLGVFIGMIVLMIMYIIWSNRYD